jgi:predicted membrane channel-forming protein YqfA (hemolysin III family)
MFQPIMFGYSRQRKDASNLIGFVSVVVSILLGSALFELRPLSSNLPVSILFFMEIGGLLLSIGLDLAGFRIRMWRDVLGVQHLRQRYTTLPL